MKKVLFILLSVILLCGCEHIHEVQKEEYNFGKFYTYCDAKYGVEYIHFINGYKAGLTVRLDENGDVIHCEGTESE